MANDNINEDDRWNAYFYPGTTTLINKLGIKDGSELTAVEREISEQKELELVDNPIVGNFDSKHLCDVHKYLFSDLYEWAGKLRDVTMTKEDYSKFTSINDIERCLEDDLELLKDNLKNVYNFDTFALELADCYLGLVTIHPFREGNGRAIREFLRELVLVKSLSLGFDQYTIDWNLIDNDKISSYMTMGPISKTLIKIELSKGIVPYNPEKKKQL